MASTQQIAKRIPSIKFPVRRPLPQGQKLENNGISVAPPPPLHVSDVPPPPQHQGSGGSASLQPRRTPVTDREIEAILLGGSV